MSKASYFGKPLKGISTIAPSITDAVASDIVTTITAGIVDFGTVLITGGTIDGTTIGSSSPGPGYFNFLQVNGFPVIFYGVDNSNFAQWEPNSGTWQIQGNLVTTGISNLGNFSISGNTISTTNSNGPINLSPNGAGGIFLNGPVQQSTASGNISFLTNNGSFSVNTSTNISLNSSSGSLSLTSGTQSSLSTRNGDIRFTTGSNIPSFTISNVSTGVSSVQVTTTLANNFVAGDQVLISGTNSIPSINGTYTISSIIDSRAFTIPVTTPVTVSGNQGSVRETNSIWLTATDYIQIPTGVPTYYGATCNSIFSDTSSNLSLNACGEIQLNPTSRIRIPANRFVVFNNTNISISSDATNLTISNSIGNISLSGNTNIAGNLTVTGTQTIVNSQVVVVQDPVFALGGQTANSVNDGMDRGILYRYGTGTQARLGFFGYQRSSDAFVYIPDATENNNIVTGAYGNAIFNRLTILEGDFQGTITTSSLTGNPDLTFTSRNTFLNSTGYVRLSENTPFYYGTSLSNSISGTGNTLNIVGGSIINLTSPRINIPANTFLSINGTNSNAGLTYTSTLTSLSTNTPLFFNTTEVRMSTGAPLYLNTARTTFVQSDTNNNLALQSAGNILLNTSQYAIMPSNTSILFNSTASSIGDNSTSLSVSTTKNLILSGTTVSINSNGNINLNPTGSVLIPTNKLLAFNTTNNSISTNGTNLLLASAGPIQLSSGGNVVIGSEANPQCVIFGFTTESICPISRSLVVSAQQNISLNPSVGHVLLNYDKQLKWTNELVYGSTSGLILSSPTAISLTNTGSADIFLTPNQGVYVPFNKFLYFGNTNSSIVSSTANAMSILSSGQVNVNSSGQINLNSSLGTLVELRNNLRITTSSVFLQTNAFIYFNSTTESVYSGTGNQLYVNSLGTLNLSGSAIHLATSQVRTNDAILSVGGIQAPAGTDTRDKGIEFYWYDTNVSASKLGFFGYKQNTGVFTFIPDGTNVGEVFSGTPGNVQFGNVIGTNFTAVSLNMSGGGITNISSVTSTALTFNITSGSFLSIPDNVFLRFGSSTRTIHSDGTNIRISNTTGSLIIDPPTTINNSLAVNSLTVGGESPYLTSREYVNATGGSTFSIDWNKSLTFISVSGTGVATCNALASTGFIKTIVITALNTGASVAINFRNINNSRLKDPGSGDITSDGTITFDTAGQSVQLIYDNFNQYWLTVNGGCYYT